MAFPEHSKYVIIGAGIHGLSSAWRLAERLKESGKGSGEDIVVLEKSGIAAGASGIACGVVRNNYFQPAMRKLMAHSVDVWESDPKGLSYHPVGYMQISSEAMRDDVRSIYEQQQAIGYESEFIEGEQQSRTTCAAFSTTGRPGASLRPARKAGRYSNQTKTMYALADKVEALGVRILTGVEVKGFKSESGSGAIQRLRPTRAHIACDHVIIGAGPWVARFLGHARSAKQITVKDLNGETHDGVDMWRYWQLEEGVLTVDPDMMKTNDGDVPPVIHVDTDAPLVLHGGRLKDHDEMWGIYYKPDWHFGGIQGGASPYKVETPVDRGADRSLRPFEPGIRVVARFAHMWVSALAHCQKRFEGTMPKYHKEPRAASAAFTPDSFPVFDHFPRMRRHRRQQPWLEDDRRRPSDSRRGAGRETGPAGTVPV